MTMRPLLLPCSTSFSASTSGREATPFYAPASRNAPPLHRRAPLPSFCSISSQPRILQAQAASEGYNSSAEDNSQLWQRLALVNRLLGVAIKEENYTLAAKLRDDSKALSAQLPPLQQYSFSQAAVLRDSKSTNEQKLNAIAALATTGEEGVLPELASCLGQPALVARAEEAMWAIFMRCREPQVSELLDMGVKLMRSPVSWPAALDVFERIIRVAPSFAEGHNKRATVLYMLGRYYESIKECRMVLEMQPLHFGAASGMGICHLQLGDHAAALAAFDLTLSIHPGLSNISHLVEDLKKQQRAKQQQETEERKENL